MWFPILEKNLDASYIKPTGRLLQIQKEATIKVHREIPSCAKIVHMKVINVLAELEAVLNAVNQEP